MAPIPFAAATERPHPLEADPDTLYGDGDDDILDGGGAPDQIWGGTGHDVLQGGTQNDTLRGEGGNDAILGGAGTNTIDGGDGDDRCTGTSCELPEPIATGCTQDSECPPPETCVVGIGVCLPCLADADATISPATATTAAPSIQTRSQQCICVLRRFRRRLRRRRNRRLHR